MPDIVTPNIVTPDTAPAKQDLVLFAGRYPKAMKQQLLQMAADLNYKVLPASIGAFKSGERFCELYPKQEELFAQNKTDIAGAVVHIVMHMHSNPDKFFVDAVNIAETVAEQQPASIHMIKPFAPFGREDRDFDQRMVSKMAKTLPKHLKCAGVDRVTTFDVHSKQAESYYIDSFGVQNVRFLSLADDLRLAAQQDDPAGTHYTVGGADGGDKPNDVAQLKACHLRDRIYGWTDYPNDHMFFITKRHKSAYEKEVLDFKGEVAGTTALLPDDMFDTGETLVKGAAAVKQHGAVQAKTLATHAVSSGDSLRRLTAPCIDDKPNPIDFLVTSDTILSIYDKAKRLPPEQQDRLRIVSCLPQIKHALTWK